MGKKSNPNCMEISRFSTAAIIENFMQGKGIIFVTENGILIGAVTDGDISRHFRHGGNAIDISIINRNISRLTKTPDIDDSKIEKQANKIFDSKPKINNIPVLDENGILLYQIDRYETNCPIQIYTTLRNMCVEKSLDVFLECHKTEHLILTGGSLDLLNIIRDTLCKELGKGNYNNVDILILYDDLSDVKENSLIISVSKSLIGLLKIFSNNIPIYSFDTISIYYLYKKLDSIDNDAVANFFALFGYDEIELYSNNKYLQSIMSKIESCNISVKERPNNLNYDAEEMNIYTYCSDSGLQERIPLERFYHYLSLIQTYRQLTEKSLTRDKYITEYNKCLKVMKDDGYAGCYFKIYNLLDSELYDTAKNCSLLSGFHMQLIDELKVAEENWLNVTYEDMCGANYLNMHDYCLMTILHTACYDLLSSYYSNVYVHGHSYRNLLKANTKYAPDPGRTIDNYIDHTISFPKNFIRNMYGTKDYPIEQVISDLRGCQKVALNQFYIKFQSNYHSQYFNTDTFGNRITINAPKNYIGSVWLLSACCYSGYAVADGDNVASLLQKKLNDLGKNYRVVIIGGHGSYLYEQIEKLFDRKVGKYDVIICQMWDYWNRSKNIPYYIKLDWEQFASKLDVDCYWDQLGHYGKKGCEIIADQLYNGIESSLFSLPERKFHLQPEMEQEIQDYIDKITEKVKFVSGSPDLPVHIKAGAIVMNCNPFTYGHKYLIETASRLVNILYIFVVEEDKSVFPFAKRMRMVKDGTKEFSNVIVLPSGKFMISSVTFPGYFTKGENGAKYYDSFLDLKIFAHYIAPKLGISLRFVGEEPFDEVTAQYNRDMKIILEEQNIDVIEIPRKQLNGETISATKVRKLLENGEKDSLCEYIPQSTLNVLNEITSNVQI